MKKQIRTLQYKLITDLPLAGKGKIYSKTEWKRIYGYDIGLVPGARFIIVALKNEI